MKKHLLFAAAALALSAPVFAQEEPAQEVAPSPNEIVDAAAADEWVSIAAEDLLVMTLAPDRDGNARQVVMQLMPAPFSQGWVENIRTLARAGWYDGISVNRVQDNYVVQWGDANVDNPEATGPAKPLPEGLRVMDEGEYTTSVISLVEGNVYSATESHRISALMHLLGTDLPPPSRERLAEMAGAMRTLRGDGYSNDTFIVDGWPVSLNGNRERDPVISPVHCYGMVGVGRSYSPDTGTGAELYTVIGHAPRHLDRNIALVGRVIEGIEHLSSLPRGTGPLGFYETAEERVPIQSITLASDVRTPPASSSEAVGDKYAFEFLSTESASFERYADARANRRDPFFIVPAGGADICNIPVPVRRVVAGE